MKLHFKFPIRNHRFKIDMVYELIVYDWSKSIYESHYDNLLLGASGQSIYCLVLCYSNGKLENQIKTEFPFETLLIIYILGRI